VIVTSGPGDSPLVVAGADVVLVEGGVSSFPLRGRTGADGKVTLGPLGAGPASVAASAPGFVARGAIPVPEPLEGEVRVSLIKGATLRGRVLDERGFPVDGATIEVIGTDSFGLPVAQTPLLMGFQRVHFAWAMSGPVPLIPAGELGVMPGPVPPIPAAGQPIAAASPGLGALPEVGEAIEPWVSRGDGTFEATPVAPGRMRALVRHPSYVEGMSRTVSLMPGETAEVEVVLRQGGMLEGRVLDSSGFPVAGARVDVSAVRGTLEQTALTASDGSFAFAAVPREIVVAAGRPDDLSRIVFKENVEVPAGGRAELEITLPKLREAVAIVVEDDERRPVGVAQVTVMSLDAKTPLRQTLFSDADGVVTVEDARALDLRILVEAPSFVRATRVVQSAPERIQINLSRGTVVKGRVTAVRGRSYVAGATVVLIAEAVRQVGRTGDDGAYAFRDVALGPVRVIATHPDFADGEVSAVVQATGRADRPFELPDLELTDPGSIEGRVLDAEGRPVAGARVGVGLVPAYLPAGALPPDVALTDEQGRFTLSSLRPGRADVEAYHAQAGRGRVPGVVVDSGRTTSNVSIRLAAEPEVDEPPQAGGLAVTLGDRSAPGGTEVVIAQVAPASEAERAGLRAGDVLLAIEGSRPADMRDARARLSGSPGTDVVLEIRRGAGNERLRVTRELVRR
jgi:protocatechuate 3,4-dioxygenase beta subunit